MINKNHSKDELLKQSGISEGDSRKLIKDILAKDTRRVSRLKWSTLSSCVLTAVIFLAAAIIEQICPHSRYEWVGGMSMTEAVARLALPVLIITFRALLLISAFLLIAFYVRSKSLTIKQINARLANIEEQLKAVLEKK
jgi:hypothetical protein